MMKINRTTTIILMIFLIQGLSLSSFAQNPTLISFKLKDQFGREYTDQSWQDSIIVLIGSDKDGSQYNGIWGKAIYDSLKDAQNFEQIKFIGLSDLRGVPFFLKGFVRGKFPKEKENWVLMDWKGKVPKAYQFESESSNILIFDRNQKLIHQTAVRQLSQEELKIIIERLKTLL